MKTIALGLALIVLGWLSVSCQDKKPPPSPHPQVWIEAQPEVRPSPIRVTPSPASRSRKIPSKVSFSPLELKIAWCESKNNYKDENPISTASGRWQVVDGTWDNYMGYHHSSHAPAWVQDKWAREYFDKNGYRAWNASKSCWR